VTPAQGVRYTSIWPGRTSDRMGKRLWSCTWLGYVGITRATLVALTITSKTPGVISTWGLSMRANDHSCKPREA
jgi:hypothetical protein